MTLFRSKFLDWKLEYVITNLRKGTGQNKKKMEKD